MNLGFSEMIFLFLLALLIFGPKKLPEIGRQLGRALNEFKRASDEFKSQIQSEINKIDVEEHVQTILPPSSEPIGSVAGGSLPTAHRFGGIAIAGPRCLKWWQSFPRTSRNTVLPAMSFLEHLEELRRRIIYSIVAVGVGFLLLGICGADLRAHAEAHCEGTA